MSKILGNIVKDEQSFNFNAKGKDYEHIQEITKLYHSTKPLYSRVILQALAYDTFSEEAIWGQYKSSIDRVKSCHIHPVIAALFLPKIKVIDEHFLYANLANIVQSRVNKKSLQTRPDYELFYALVTDPNDIVCDNKSPAKDLLNRCNLQHHLWNSVLNLRSGQYYNCRTQQFIGAINKCRLNKYDTPDLYFGQYDGTVIKRLLAAFSFRPTVVATMPTPSLRPGHVSVNPYVQNINPHVRSIPMLNLNIPLNLDHTQNALQPIPLESALTQHQLFMNKDFTMTSKQQSLIYSRGVLIFFVNRIAHIVRVNRLQPFSLTNIPQTAVGVRRLNQRQVLFQPDFTLRGDKFTLRSVILNEVNAQNQIPGTNLPPLIVGSSTLFKIDPDFKRNGRWRPTYYHYNPLNAKDVDALHNPNWLADAPIVELPYTPLPQYNNKSFKSYAENRGTVFIYETVKNNSTAILLN